MTDGKLGQLDERIEKNVKVFGDISINEKEKAALETDPEFRVYERNNEINLEVEIEKACTKARYHFMGEEENKTDAARDNNNNDEKYEAFDLENKIANYANLRATDLPTVQRLYPPKPSSIQREVIMQSVKD